MSKLSDFLFLGTNWQTVSGTETVEVGGRYIVEPGSVVVLPSSAVWGDIIQLVPGGDWSSTAATVSGSSNILGSSATLNLDVNMGLTVVYKNAAWGWSLGI